jgi:hypothetical protein
LAAQGDLEDNKQAMPKKRLWTVTLNFVLFKGYFNTISNFYFARLNQYKNSDFYFKRLNPHKNPIYFKMCP